MTPGTGAAPVVVIPEDQYGQPFSAAIRYTNAVFRESISDSQRGKAAR